VVHYCIEDIKDTLSTFANNEGAGILSNNNYYMQYDQLKDKLYTHFYIKNNELHFTKCTETQVYEKAKNREI